MKVAQKKPRSLRHKNYVRCHDVVRSLPNYYCYYYYYYYTICMSLVTGLFFPVLLLNQR